MKVLKRARAMELEGVDAVAVYFGAYKLIARPSTHSFTGQVVECHFRDAESALLMAGELKQLMGIFIALRVNSEDSCYISVPYDLPF